MCGRFTLSRRDRQELAAELGVPVEQIPESEYRPRYNIAPTDPHWIVRLRYEDREIVPAKWGLVNSWAKDASRAARQINARAETIDRLPAFREAFQKRRCVVPADGFFEWTTVGGKRQPIWFHRPDGGLILFAGLFESWRPEPAMPQRTFTIITTRPNGLIAPIHDRMPVILPDEAVEEWLDLRQTHQRRLLDLLAPAEEPLLVGTPVSARVNSVAFDDRECLAPAL